jgi:uncharacterized protein YcbK (DUF882 family)
LCGKFAIVSPQLTVIRATRDVVDRTGNALPDLNTSQTPSGASKHGFMKSLVKGFASCAVVACLATPLLTISASQAAAETRSLKLYFTHTKERAEIVFKRNGKFDPRGLNQINQILRDWRRNEPTKMDPRLLDLVWEVYRRAGARDYIHVVSAYRSPATNGMLRSRSKGVAKTSQHMLGKAMDFYIPGVKISTLRGIAMQLQVGGVGYYPTSGSPFVHLDVGGVRAWPRMKRQELVRLFPNGNTVHLPADGKPLPGYDVALASYKKRLASGTQIEIASTSGSQRKRPNLLAALFGGGDEDEDADAIATPAPAERPTPVAPVARAEEPVMTAAAQAESLPGVDIPAPVPLSRPAFRQDGGPGGLATALYSPARNTAQEALQAVVPATPQPAAPAQAEAFADLQQYAIPIPTMLGQRALNGDAEAGMMTASADGALPDDALASVPLPSARPSGAETLLASSSVDPEIEADLDEQAALTPAVIAALAESGAYVRSSMASPAIPAAPKKPVEVAALPAEAKVPSAADMRFGDGFDAPPQVAVPTKGGRAAGNATAAAAPALTGDMLAKWALNNSRAEDVASVKAPRVQTWALNADAAYTVGNFKPVAKTASIDPRRFSTNTSLKR